MYLGLNITFFPKPKYTFVRRYLEECYISNFKIQLSTIFIVLLSMLGHFQYLPSHLYLICIMLKDEGALCPSIRNIIPIIWNSTQSTIQSFEKSHNDTRMIVIVVGEFNQFQVFISFTFSFKCACSQYILQSSDGPLYLSHLSEGEKLNLF